MAISLNTNVSALQAQNALTKNARNLSSAMEQLSTGKRINAADDDAAGLAISQNQTAQIRGLNMAVRNMSDGINLLQTADGAMTEQSNMLQRMRELAVQASNGTYSQTQRSYLQTEFKALSTQIDKIGSETTWNGMTVLSGTTGGTTTGVYSFQTGSNAGNTISITLAGTTVSALGITAFGDVTSSTGGGVSTVASASGTITAIDTALNTLNTQRANIGAVINQMTYASDNVANISANVEASRSTILDTDYATASSNLSKGQIIQQAATAMLAQANAQPQSILALLK
jgi:flagellin